MRKIYLPPIIAGVLLTASCSKDDPKPKPASGVESMTLIYAVNRSSLSSDFSDDSREMLSAMAASGDEAHKLLLFRTDSESECGLYEAVADKKGVYAFELLKRFPRDVTSTDPARLAEVVDYALSLYPEARKNLFFWGHGMSWNPTFSDHQVKIAPKDADLPEAYGYGGEYCGVIGGSTDWMEITELADALPDDAFDTIWFDCCYMSGIETIYQLRDKCDYFVAYPTEVCQYGLPYDLVLPYVMTEKPDLVKAAQTFFDYYSVSGDPVTVACLLMDKVEPVADAVKRIYASGIGMPNLSEVANYSRSYNSPFYDLTQYVGKVAEANGSGSELLEAYRKAMSEFVIYSACSPYDFNSRPWKNPDLSGISTHHYQGLNNKEEAFYSTLDWHKRVY